MLRADHDCELNLKIDDEGIYIPGKGLCRRGCGVLRKACMASHTNPCAKRYLRSRAAITYENRRHMRNYKRVVHPFSIFRHWWNFLMIFTLAAGLLMFPYETTFNMYSTFNPELEMWRFSKIAIDALCCADVILNLMTGYYDKVLSSVQMEQRQIIIRYMLHGTFVPDVIGSMPMEVILIHLKKAEPIVAYEVLSLLKIFRVFSLHAYMKQMAFTYDITPVNFAILNLIFWIALFLHWQACMLFLVPIAAVSMGPPKLPKEDSWIIKNGILSYDMQDRYWHCLFRAVDIFTRSGLDDLGPETSEDQYLVIVLLIISSLIFCLTVALVMQMFQGENSSNLKFQAMQAQLKEYMRYKQLPSTTQRRFIAYYEFRFQNCYFRESEILNMVSAQIRQEIGMHSCRKLVENVTFFNNLPMSLLIRIVSFLRSEIFLTNDVIVRANQPGDCMYFIASGTVAIYTTSGKEVCHLEDGAHFGEIALVMPDERRVASVVAVEVCELYRLERADFARTIHPYPMLWERIKKIAMERNEKTTSLNAQYT